MVDDRDDEARAPLPCRYGFRCVILVAFGLAGPLAVASGERRGDHDGFRRARWLAYGGRNQSQFCRARTRHAGRTGRQKACCGPLCLPGHLRHLATSAAMNAFAFASYARFVYALTKTGDTIYLEK